MAIHGEGSSCNNVGNAPNLENRGAGPEVHPNAGPVGNEATGVGHVAQNRYNDVGEPTATVVPMPFTEAGYASCMTCHFMRELESVRKEVRSTHGQVVELESFYQTLRTQFVTNVVCAETRGRQLPLPTPPTSSEQDNPRTWI